VNLDDWIDWERSKNIVSLFSTFVYLKKFFSREAVGLFCQADSRKEPNSDSTKGALNGLKLATVVALDSYITNVVDAPDLLGVKPDEDYYDYTHFTKGRGRSIARGAARPDHTISKFVSKANILLFRIMGINDWRFIEAYRSEFDSFADSLRSIFVNCYLAEDYRGNRVDVEFALNVDSADHMVANYTNGTYLLNIYTNYYHDFSPKVIPPYDEVFDEFQLDCRSRFDPMSLISEFLPKRIPDSWAVGYAMTIHETLKSVITNEKKADRLVDLDKIVQEIRRWGEFERYCKKLDDVTGMPALFAHYKYSVRQSPPSNMILDLLAEPGVRESPERLLSILGNRARIVDSGYSSAAALNFITLLDGAIARSKRTNTKVRLAIFIHKLDSRRENYSLGLFMPAYGEYGLTNASMWWIFYYIGNNHSGTASQQWRQVWNKISRNAKHIKRIRILADEEEFLKYCEDPGYTRLDTAVRCMDQMVGRVRGTYPELLIANMLSNIGFYPVRLRSEPAFLKEHENVNGDLDVVGFKVHKGICEIVVFESKGSAGNDTELDGQLRKFSNTVGVLTNNADRLCKECGIVFEGKYRIRGYFVLMADMPNADVPTNVTFWDFSRFLGRLERSGIPQIYLDLLKETRVAIELGSF